VVLQPHQPVVANILEADPAGTDLSWVGECLSVHLCHDVKILELGTPRLRTRDRGPGRASVWQPGAALYVLSYLLHAVNVQLQVILVGNQLGAASKPRPLKGVIVVAENAD
jgi:hypothetical protein